MTEAQADIVIALLADIRNLCALATTPQAPEPCPHPLEMRTNLSTMSRDAFRCTACGYVEAIDKRTGEPLSI